MRSNITSNLDRDGQLICFDQSMDSLGRRRFSIRKSASSAAAQMTLAVLTFAVDAICAAAVERNRDSLPIIKMGQGGAIY